MTILLYGDNYLTSNGNNIQRSIKSSLRRKLNMSPAEYCNIVGIELPEKCRFCGDEYPPFNFTLRKNSNVYEITGIELIHDDKIYCFGKNSSCEGKNYNANSSEFLSVVLDITIDDAKTYIRSRNKSPFYRENFDDDEQYKKSQSRNLSYFIDKYGHNIGKLKYDKFIECKKYSYSIESYIERFGERGKDIFDDIQKSKALTLEKWIDLYGEDEGIKKRNEWISKCTTVLPMYSKEANSVLETITRILGITTDDIQSNFLNTDEYRIYGNGFTRCYDWYSPSLNLIIEYNGITWHCNENWNEDKIRKWRNPFTQETGEECIIKDNTKTDMAKNLGHNIIVLWSDDTIEYNIKKVKDEINRIQSK